MAFKRKQTQTIEVEIPNTLDASTTKLYLEAFAKAANQEELSKLVEALQKPGAIQKAIKAIKFL
jgi:hypothetical protein